MDRGNSNELIEEGLLIKSLMALIS